MYECMCLTNKLIVWSVQITPTVWYCNYFRVYPSSSSFLFVEPLLLHHLRDIQEYFFNVVTHSFSLQRHNKQQQQNKIIFLVTWYKTNNTGQQFYFAALISTSIFFFRLLSHFDLPFNTLNIICLSLYY